VSFHYFGSIFDSSAGVNVDALYTYTAPAAEMATFWARQCSYVYTWPIIGSYIQCSDWSYQLSVAIL
jgi:hypothetical protein